MTENKDGGRKTRSTCDLKMNRTPNVVIACGNRLGNIEKWEKPLKSRRYLVPNQSYNYFWLAILHLSYSDIIKGTESLPEAVRNIPHETN
jgi:hypothetical protein